MAAWVLEARHRPTWRSEIKKTKLQIYLSPQADINTLLGTGRFSRPLDLNRSKLWDETKVIQRV